MSRPRNSLLGARHRGVGWSFFGSTLAYVTPSFANAWGGQPSQFGLNVLPMYSRSFTPTRLDQNPDDVRSRNRLKKFTPASKPAGARAGHAMSFRISSRWESVASAKGFPNLVFDCESIHVRP